ncbi:MAG: efflux RND transporter permease subunit [Planctomycetes bacterium]|nr:efflux RND transporter permease subunit [Planctomycetota bacterium]NOG55098.1 efflux RND transporter permease subunit [Planctomycetota bacterium]
MSDHAPSSSETPALARGGHGFVNSIVKAFLHSNLSLIFILVAALAGIGALVITPREEEPQIVVPMADIYVDFPGHTATEVEQLVATPLERLLYQIDGVEYVYSTSKNDQAVITVRFYVGEDRERSLVKLYKRIDESVEHIPPGLAGWVVKPVEIDDVPIVNFALTSNEADEYALRRVAEEVVARLAQVRNVSRTAIVGGQARVATVRLIPDRLRGYSLSPLEIQQALSVSNVSRTAGTFKNNDDVIEITAGPALSSVDDLRRLVIAVHDDRTVRLADVAEVSDGPDEAGTYVRFGQGPAADRVHEVGTPGWSTSLDSGHPASASQPAVVIAVAKQKGSNAVWVADDVVREAKRLTHEVVPDNMQLIVTRNYGLTANEKVNELVEALGVAIVIVIALLTIGLGWREAFIVAVAVPVVFGLTLVVNYLAGYTINRVTLFALILSLGLLVDDPIVDVENIVRHFKMHGRASRAIVLEAIAEIRPPLITATLAVIVSFLPMFFITDMMGPYMAPMALNVPMTMLMSMAVAFTITPWLSYHVLKKQYQGTAGAGTPVGDTSDIHDFANVERTMLYRVFRPLMQPMLDSSKRAWLFLGVMGLLMVVAVALAAVRQVPLKMLPFGNKDELQLVIDMPEGTTLEHTDRVVREVEQYLRTVPEVTGFSSFVGTSSPMNFNGMVRHYYLRQGEHLADVAVNFVNKKHRHRQTHTLALAIRDDLVAIVRANGGSLAIVETPPGPPTIAPVVAEVRGRPDHSYQDLIDASAAVRARMELEPGMVDVDDMVEAPMTRMTFVTDQEKAALNGISVDDVTQTIEMALSGRTAGTLAVPDERNPLRVVLWMPRAVRSSLHELGQIQLKGRTGNLVPLAEIGRWEQTTVPQSIYHKNLQPIVYVFADTAGRPPADAIVDIEADRQAQATLAGSAQQTGSGYVMTQTTPRPLGRRTFVTNGSGIGWSIPDGIDITFSGEGEWKTTLRVFRDLGIAFGVALVGIYILLVAQTSSFSIPVVVMVSIPLTVIGIMPGFWILNMVMGRQAGGYDDVVYFTATAMIGMIALAGIVTRQAIILVDFIHLALKQGRSLKQAILESCVVRLRPILLTATTAMASAFPIVIDPVFSGLAWALIFGLFASTTFTLFVIPLTYYLVYRNVPGHGVSPAGA